MQYIFIQDLRVETVIGVYEQERLAPQVLRFDVEAGIPDRRAFTTDELGDTVDYAELAGLIKRELQSHSHVLLERLAGHLCQQIEREFDVSWLRMRIAKCGIVPGAAEVGVVLERGAAATPTVQSLFGPSVAIAR